MPSCLIMLNVPVNLSKSMKYSLSQQKSRLILNTSFWSISRPNILNFLSFPPLLSSNFLQLWLGLCLTPPFFIYFQLAIQIFQYKVSFSVYHLATINSHSNLFNQGSINAVLKLCDLFPQHNKDNFYGIPYSFSGSYFQDLQ